MLKTVKIVALNSDISAALALVSEANPRLFALASCEGDDVFAMVRQALAQGEEAYLSSAGDAVSQRLAEVLKVIREILAKAENIQILLAATQEDEAGIVFYLLGRKESLGAYLLRDGGFTNLCPSASDYQLISGVLKPGDRVVLTTESLLNLLGGERDLFQKTSLDRLEEEITGRLPEAENFPVAAAVIEVEEDLARTAGPAANSDKLPVLPNLALSFPARAVYSWTGSLVKKFIPRSKRGAAVLGVFIFIVLIASLVFTFKNKKEAESSAAFKKNFDAAIADYNKAESLKDLDSAGASIGLANALKEVESALKISPGDPRALDLKKQIEGNSGDILRVYKVDNLPLWLDLSLIKEGMSANGLSLSLGKLLLLDDKKSVLAEVDLKNKSQQLLGGGEKLGAAKLASINGEMAWVFSSDKGVVRIDTKSQVVTTAIKPDSAWGTIGGIYGFAGNVYLLDLTNGQIWKYLPLTSGYSDKRAYLKTGVKGDFVAAQKMQIDSSVWILQGGGELVKYTQGSPDYFSLSGLDKSVQAPKSFFVSDATDNLYLLDSGNNRLLVLDKKGVYKSQYRSDKFGSFADLVVDEEGEKAYFLDSSKIYSLDLK